MQTTARSPRHAWTRLVGLLTQPPRFLERCSLANLTRVVLPAIILLGAGLRLLYLGRDDFWTDEIDTAHYASSWVRVYQDTHPPLFFSLMRVWLEFFPVLELPLRLPAAIAGILSVGAVYLLAQRLFGRLTGLISAGLVALSTMHVWHAQEARMYTLLSLNAALSTWAMLRCRQEPGFRNVGLYLLTLVALVYSHLFGLMLGGIQGLFTLSSMLLTRTLSPRRGLVLVAIQLAGATSLLPWLIYLLLNPGTQRVGWIAPLTWQTVTDVFDQFASGSELNLLLLSMLGALTVAHAFAGRGASVLDVQGTASRGNVAQSDARVESGSRLPDREGVVLLLMLLFVPIGIAIAVSVVAMPLFVSRYLIASSIPFYILAARGLVLLRPWTAQLAIVVALLVIAACSLWGYFESPHRSSWQEFVKTFAPRVQPDDLLVFEGIGPELLNYYAGREGLLQANERVRLRPIAEPNAPAPLVLLERALADRPRVSRFWLVHIGAAEDREINQYVRREFRQLDDQSIPGIRARLFQVRRRAALGVNERPTPSAMRFAGG